MVVCLAETNGRVKGRSIVIKLLVNTRLTWHDNNFAQHIVIDRQIVHMRIAFDQAHCAAVTDQFWQFRDLRAHCVAVTDRQIAHFGIAFGQGGWSLVCRRTNQKGRRSNLGSAVACSERLLLADLPEVLNPSSREIFTFLLLPLVTQPRRFQTRTIRRCCCFADTSRRVGFGRTSQEVVVINGLWA